MTNRRLLSPLSKALRVAHSLEERQEGQGCDGSLANELVQGGRLFEVNEERVCFFLPKGRRNRADNRSCGEDLRSKPGKGSNPVMELAAIENLF